MDGLVHVSELSFQHVNHPSEVVKVGDEVTVKVLEVDLDRERISLSIKQTMEDPWVKFSREHGINDVVDGTVTKTVPFGAFVSVGDGVEGLVHVSEIAIHRGPVPQLELSIGQAVSVKVTEMDEERRRVSLSIKQANPDWKDREPEERAPRPSNWSNCASSRVKSRKRSRNGRSMSIRRSKQFFKSLKSAASDADRYFIRLTPERSVALCWVPGRFGRGGNRGALSGRDSCAQKEAT